MMPLFVILFEYLAEALMTFWHIGHFCRNFPFSPQICHFLITAICQDFPLCHLIWGFAKPLMDSCHFFQLLFSWKLPAANSPFLLSHLFFLPDLRWILAKLANFAKYVIFVRPTIIDMPFFHPVLIRVRVRVIISSIFFLHTYLHLVMGSHPRRASSLGKTRRC